MDNRITMLSILCMSIIDAEIEASRAAVGVLVLPPLSVFGLDFLIRASVRFKLPQVVLIATNE